MAVRRNNTYVVATFFRFISLFAGDIVKRGCISDLIVGEQQMCRRNPDTCKTCMGNDCNRELNYRTCYACNSLTDTNCITPNTSTPKKICQNYFDQCLTHIDGENVIRGCAEEHAGLAIECAENEKCELCAEGEYCNAKNVAQEFCYNCDSEVDGNCREQPSPAMSKACNEEGLSLTRQGCYRFDDTGKLRKNFVSKYIFVFIPIFFFSFDHFMIESLSSTGGPFQMTYI